MREPTEAEALAVYNASGGRIRPCAACGGSGVMGYGQVDFVCNFCRGGYDLIHDHWLEGDRGLKDHWDPPVVA